MAYMRPTDVVFAAQYATEPGDRHKPSSNEIIDMHKRAVEVVRLMDQLRRMDNGQEPMPQDEQTRAPKRPWEDVDGESEGSNSPLLHPCHPGPNENALTSSSSRRYVLCADGQRGPR